MQNQASKVAFRQGQIIGAERVVHGWGLLLPVGWSLNHRIRAGKTVGSLHVRE